MKPVRLDLNSGELLHSVQQLPKPANPRAAQIERLVAEIECLGQGGDAVIDQFKVPVRPVQCWYCGQAMHYRGHVAHEPEVRLTLDTGDADQTIYLHTRCWNDWQQRRRDGAQESKT